MSGTSEILQSYLVSLGFQTDAISLRKFEDHLGKTGKKVLGVGTAVAGVVASVEAASAAFAYSMRKMYFTSELANTSVKNLQAFSFAGKQFGISSESMTGAIHGMAQAMRLNPGLQGLVESFGIKVSGRDVSDVMLDFVNATKSMPEYVGAQYASLFGMDPDTYHQVITHMDELKRKKEEQLKLGRDLGFDIDAQKQSVLEYTSALDALGSKFSMLSSAMLSSLLPAFRSVSKEIDDCLNHSITAWSKISKDVDAGKGFWASYWKHYLKPQFGGWQEKPAATPKQEPETQQPAPVPGGKLDQLLKKNAIRPPVVTGKDVGIFGSLESQYNLPPGLLDSVWATESGRGANMKSKAGAEGHFQFMPDTAKQYGVNDPYDLQQSATGAAKMYANLMKKYNGDVGKAAAAYNWGEGNMDSYLKTGKGLKGQDMPSETRGYVARVLNGAHLGGASSGAVTFNQTTTINVTGTDAKATGKAVEIAQSNVNKNIVRQFADLPQ